MTIGEARQILDVKENSTKEIIEDKYKHLFEVNERTKGGSFYIQSKVKQLIDIVEGHIYNTYNTY